ncbi:hypothetical protein TEQG_08863 [Trichophyton equinum CBS 127.97]|uniref:Uncharacterized protein n=1 Tax=Trichophyton equinum (strain ATCC MYA-4606 / CBS 127.97) TaxID=559882 RepID=F2Q650_TRIEC|nr:hypothetical protein TEQG_08863 [Trichophyton equinum CBS 127.97]
MAQRVRLAQRDHLARGAVLPEGPFGQRDHLARGAVLPEGPGPAAARCIPIAPKSTVEHAWINPGTIRGRLGQTPPEWLGAFYNLASTK